VRCGRCWIMKASIRLARWRFLDSEEDRLLTEYAACMGEEVGWQSGHSPGVPSDVAAKLEALECKNREFRQANEILRKASAYFAQAELDRRSKP